MVLKHIVPKLAITLRDDFRVNPRNQDMEPLQRVLAWSPIIRPSILSKLLETEFFTKWLDVLHIWLIQPQASFKEVAKWYSFWKETFPESIQNTPGVSRSFTRGLQLMNKAIELGPDAPTHLPPPDHHEEPPTPNHPIRGNLSKGRPTQIQEITFRSIVEEFAASHNLLLIPTGKAHEKSRIPLLRVSPTADGKGGLLIYISGDAVWAPAEGGEYRAIRLDDMVTRASA
jgi:tuftelin-interacting protein 11